MPSVTDYQQQSSKNNGKSTPPPQQQQQSINSTPSGITTDTTNVDPITQAILMLEKKQRNLGKRKVKFYLQKKSLGFYLKYLFNRKNLRVMNKKQKLVKNLIKIKRLN
jgi:hypothetical protein